MTTQPPANRNGGAHGARPAHLAQAGRSGPGGIVSGSKYGSARAQAGTPIAAKRPNIKVLTRQISFLDWWNREMKEGGMLHRYLEGEKHLGARRLRAVARQHWKREQNKKSDFKLRCVLPAREFFRLRAMDPDFFKCDTNIKNLIRDTPEVRPWKD